MIPNDAMRGAFVEQGHFDKHFFFFCNIIYTITQDMKTNKPN